ncbi:hydrolase [Zobellella taiwanensis]|jgi:nicotinamidase-related amidase|uniref:Hydrolase n=1 Tax=Zobellella taiwanensis TaxID=347535 RepID=A0A2P7R6Z6_9GAMM|nr:hydrolase [Zobellella taiwanensis]PSJ45967.1 hydrolase [Zobellella taiwanensis]
MLIEFDKAALMVIDVQDKLVPAIDRGERLAARVQWLVAACRQLGTPILFTEQYPKGLGHTLGALTALAEPPRVVEKMHFSVVAAGCLPEDWQAYRQIVVCGMETHVCVLQTVLDLLREGREVFVVADAVGSRSEENRQLGLARMRDAGAHIVSREMVVFELLHRSGTEQFKQISKQFLVGEQP